MHTFTHSLTLSVSFSLPHSRCLSLSLSPLSSFVCVCMFLSFVHSHTYSTPSHAGFCSDLNANMSVSTHADMDMHTAYPPSPPHTHTLTNFRPPNTHTLTHYLSLSRHAVTHPTHPKRMVTPLMACAGTPPYTTFPRSLKGDSTLPYC